MTPLDPFAPRPRPGQRWRLVKEIVLGALLAFVVAIGVTVLLLLL